MLCFRDTKIYIIRRQKRGRLITEISWLCRNATHIPARTGAGLHLGFGFVRPYWAWLASESTVSNEFSLASWIRCRTHDLALFQHFLPTEKKKSRIIARQNNTSLGVQVRNFKWWTSLSRYAVQHTPANQDGVKCASSLP